MSDSTLTEELPAQATSAPANRLTIAHLLLWTATTAVVFSYCEPVGPGSVFTGPRDALIIAARKDEELARRWRSFYFVNVAFAPIYGIALAGLAIAGWRAAHRKPGFPSQPGHWLLVIIGAAIALLGARLHYSLAPPVASYADSLGLVIVASIAVLAAIHSSSSIWRVQLLTFAASMFLASPNPDFFINPNRYVPLTNMAGIWLAIAVVTAICCVAADWVHEFRYDLFHWAGLATLLGTLGHFVAMRVAWPWP